MGKGRIGLVAVTFSAVVVSACGAGKVVRPQDPSYNGAVNGGGGGDDKHAPTGICHKVDAEGTPLIVDWRPEDRGDLEASMHSGIAVLHYDCNGLKLLPDCKAEGSYGFVGITKKEQIISLNDAEEAKANLPMNGGQIGAAIGRGSALDIALVMVGKSTASTLKTARSALSGRCDGATHFVRSATLGAFAMKTRTGGKAESAAAMFGVGASGSSTSNRSIANKEGELEACAKADVEAVKAPKSCQAPLRVQLLALDKELDEKEAKKSVACPDGLAYVDGKCTKPVAAPTEVLEECEFGKTQACDKQCEHGNIEACTTLSLDAMIDGLLEDDPMNAHNVLAAKAAKKGCDLGDAGSCGLLGSFLLRGDGIAKDREKGEAVIKDACFSGDSFACDRAGDLYKDENIRRAMNFYERSCNTGGSQGCNELAGIYAKGATGVRKDPAKAHRFYQSACKLGSKTACSK